MCELNKQIFDAFCLLIVTEYGHNVWTLALPFSPGEANTPRCDYIL